MLIIYIALGLFAGFAALELLAGGRRFPRIPLWRPKGIAFLALYLTVSIYAPLLWDGWLGRYRLVDATVLPLPLQFAGALLVVELGTYAWHRSMHGNDFLWRWFHQMHHSAERIDVWGTFYFSPLDMLGWSLLGSLCLVLGFGISGEAALAVGITLMFLSLFQHANIRTPHWLGYLIVRPESHTIHHQRGVHRYNYCDLPLWDMIFGTFHNPRECEVEAGFYDGASRKIGAMLRGTSIA